MKLLWKPLIPMTSSVDIFTNFRCDDPSRASIFQIVIPGPQVPLSDLYLEPFRWDQRLYSLVLRMAATDDRSRELTNGNQFVEKASDSPINAMCEVTGGKGLTDVCCIFING